MSKFAGLYEVRDGKEADISLIMSTFLKGLYHDNEWFGMIPRKVFFEHYHGIAESLIRSPNATVQVACLKDDPDTIIGYSILSTDFQTIHWVYVKKAWRGHGIGTSLLPERPTNYTHFSEAGLKIIPKRFKDIIFNPFAIR